jgi:hypothetical protein
MGKNPNPLLRKGLFWAISGKKLTKNYRHFVKKFISLTDILMNIQYISTSTEHIYYISASTKLQPSVPKVNPGII